MFARGVFLAIPDFLALSTVLTATSCSPRVQDVRATRAAQEGRSEPQAISERASPFLTGSDTADPRHPDRLSQRAEVQTTAARQLADSARIALGSGQFLQAEAYLRKALIGSVDSAIRPAIDSLREAVLVRRKQMVELEEVERLLQRREYTAAGERLKELVPTLSDGYILDSARTLWAATHPTLFDNLAGMLSRWFSAVAAPFVLGAMLVLLIPRAWSRLRPNHWTFSEIADSTDRGIGDFMVSYISYWTHQEPPPITTGLSLLPGSRIALSPGFSLADSRFVLAKELEAVSLSVAGLSIDSAAKLVGAVNRWVAKKGQEIRAIAYKGEGKRLIAVLTATYFEQQGLIRRLFSPKRRVVSVISVADDELPDAARFVTEEVTFKMLYVLATKTDFQRGESAGELRKGLTKLRSYVTGTSTEKDGKSWEELETAHEIFERVRRSWPESLDASLYEGIALDLLERHEEAIERFRHVKSQAENELQPRIARCSEALERKSSDLKNARRLKDQAAINEQLVKIRAEAWEKIALQESTRELARTLERAKYNEAIAELRNLYGLKGIKRCIELVTDFIGEPTTDELTRAPIKALALAVKADAYASLPISWKYVVGSDKLEVDILSGAASSPNDAAKLKVISAYCVTKVEAIAQQLQAVLEAASRATGIWDSTSLRQLEWAIQNAKGDLYLYIGVQQVHEAASRRREIRPAYVDLYALVLLARQVLDQDSALVGWKAAIAKALEALRRCEMLLPPGVETLSNLGTLFLYRAEEGDLEKARGYLKRAIELNPNYEYAYYRLAQSWEMERRREGVLDVLKSLPKPPQIAGFQGMFREYYVQPLTDPARAAPTPEKEAGEEKHGQSGNLSAGEGR